MNECFEVRPGFKQEFGSREDVGSLVVELFNHCLFWCKDTYPALTDFHHDDTDLSTLPKDYVKTKSSDSRKAAY